ncbi:Wuschel-related homeobox [Thalictrum thalictroides]|uniref:Wuschel-related homeobox n=1 Tax=Thalictrum thalictroides TaxID=46969 RepID=A0A7J6UU65_THATH|nr:Wuschel-related homeobox [Thalictrum thalictroides]
MTDEQIELLRKQISIYSTICEQLVEMHKSISSQHDLSGMKLGNLYCDSLMTSTGNKTSRQRWTPTPVQLQILDRIFDGGNGFPGKLKIKEITNELTQHGPISETNVYNWFQNRRARSKRKQMVKASNNAESDIEIEDECSIEKKTNSDGIHSQKSPVLRSDETCLQNVELQPPDSQSNSSNLSGGRVHQISFYESVLSNSRIDCLMGKMEEPGDFNPFSQGEGYDMSG